MKQLFLSFLIFLVSLTSIAQKQKADNRFEGLDSELNKVLETWNAAGFAVAVVEKDKIIYSKGFGYKDYENKIPITPNTLFAIGSSSKAFTSGLLGILREEKKLSFDDSPSKHIPDLRFYNNEMNNLITIKDIMTHRTGLPRHDLSWYFFTTQSRDSLMQRIQYQEPFAKPRENWYYNNFMFLTQGVIAERITGKTWEENIQEKFFDPLEMKTSNAVITGLKNGKDASFGYEVKNDSIIKKMDYYDIAAMGPAGSINSNVNEMSNWLITWINGGKFKGNQILPEAYVKEAMSPQMIMANSIPDKEFPDMHISTYGYGWMVSSYKGHYRVEHGGNINGFSANAAFFPMDSIGIVVLSNQNGSPIPGIVRNIISDRLLKVDKTDWNKVQKEKADEAKKQASASQEQTTSIQKKGTKTSHLLAEFTGDYIHPGYGKIAIQFERDSLFASTPYQKVWLKHFHYNIFSLVGMEKGKVDTTTVSPMQFNFRINNMGEIASLSFKAEPMVDAIEFKRTPKEVALEKETLEKYTGDYDLGGQVAKFYLKEGNENTLFLFVAGQPEYELLSLGQHKFALKIADGYTVEFKEESNGKFQQAVFVQPNGTFKAERK
ncbi:CubicO group peptidase, beta-lactamase class C family [Aquiflexum balticum DSM 16537]|uniref:CubicO group peptidase, beta-lactamase class C family n=1 Tax=Aquiflexum balticum DSM 16537 TaxID=758820 RepID=A0A1W2H214_9BACT|nr:serine hydrolase [Aquiflexum balticum]SMD42953.1 CubicO group peptidase, beta-lactamase class C family [Aquiflexum balticum DSM 16537]